MAIDPINMVSATQAEMKMADTNPVDFSDWLAKEINSTDQKIKAADHEVRKLAVGEAENVHQVMSALSKAEVSFELTAQVRNRLLESFQQILRMSI